MSYCNFILLTDADSVLPKSSAADKFITYINNFSQSFSSTDSETDHDQDPPIKQSVRSSFLIPRSGALTSFVLFMLLVGFAGAFIFKLTTFQKLQGNAAASKVH